MICGKQAGYKDLSIHTQPVALFIMSESGQDYLKVLKMNFLRRSFGMAQQEVAFLTM